MITLKGRHWVVLWLAFFLLVTVVVETRQLKAFGVAKQLQTLRDRHRTLDGVRADLERQITEASSRRVLLPRAAALGLHVPTDAEEALIERAPADARRR
jgi:hypothetical protein